MLAIPSNVVSSLDLQTGLEVARKVLMTLEEAHPGVLGTSILHLVNPPIFCTQYCVRILDREIITSNYFRLSLTHIKEVEVSIAGGQTLRLDPRA